MEVERVQAVASITAESIPTEYIRPEQEQPALSTYQGAVPEIPCIDMGAPEKEKVVEVIAKASKEWGIFQVVNHGIPNHVIAKLQSVGKEFFELPLEEKEAYAKIPGSDSVDGYGTKLQKDPNGKKSWVDHLFHKIWPPPSINYRFWPKNPPSYREVTEEYASYLRGVADKLFGYLSLGLGLHENALKEAVGGEDLEYNLKINYYPPCPRPDLTLGVVAHTDMSTLTILVPNDVPGLQVLKDDRWIDAAYIPNALIIHIGDQIQILSNGQYRSVTHRSTVNKEKARMSWPVFLEPPAELEVGPLPQFVDDQNPPKFNKKTFKEYQYRKLNKLPQ